MADDALIYANIGDLAGADVGELGWLVESEHIEGIAGLASVNVDWFGDRVFQSVSEVAGIGLTVAAKASASAKVQVKAAPVVATKVAPVASGGNWPTVLQSGAQLLEGQFIQSPNGRFKLGISGGRFQLKEGSRVVWGGWGNGNAYRYVMQADGNGVVYTKAGGVIAATDTNKWRPCRTMVDDNGLAVVRDASNAPRWDSVHGTETSGSFFSAAFNVVKTAAKTVSPVTNLITAPATLAVAVGTKVAKGDIKGAWNSAKSQVAAVANNPVLKVGSSFVGSVPGLGTLAGPALQAGLSLARGESLSEIGLSAIKGALPGGPLAQMAFDGGIAALQGKNIADAALSQIKAKLPAEAQAGFDLGLSLVKSTTASNPSSPTDVAGEYKARAAADLQAKTARPPASKPAAQQGFDVAMAYSRGRAASTIAVMAKAPAQPAMSTVTKTIAAAVDAGKPIPSTPVVAVPPTVASVQSKTAGKVIAGGAFAAALTAALVLL